MATKSNFPAKLLVPTIAIGFFFAGNAFAGKYSCSMSARDVLHPHEYSDYQTNSAVRDDLTWLHTHGERINPSQSSRCGSNDGKGKKERANLKLFRQKNIALGCFCSNNKSRVETNPASMATSATQAAQAATSAQPAASAPTSGKGAAPDFSVTNQEHNSAYGGLNTDRSQFKDTPTTATTVDDPYEGYQYGAGN